MYKLVLTDHSDAWTPGGLINVDVKYGMSSKFSLGVEGSWMKTYAADLSAKPGDGAGSSFDKIDGGPQQRGTVIGLIGEYQFSEDGTWAPYFDVGAGMYFWKWTDADGNTLLSDDAALDDPLGGLYAVPDADQAGNPYELKDQELYLMAGLGIDYYASDLISIGLGVKFRYLTRVFTDFTDDKDIVGSDPGQLDLPKGIVEGLLGLTFHFGGKCPEMSGTGSPSATTGIFPMDVQFESSATGGCPEYTYAWNFGDGTTSTEANPSHTYAQMGTYSPSLTITDAKGNSALAAVPSITVNCAPMSASASGNPTSGTAPFTAAFRGIADGGCPPFTYAWDFGDGTTSADQNPSHDYAIQGTFTTTLTITDAKGASAKSTVPVTVSSPLVPTAQKSVVLEGVNFKSNRSTLLPESETILNNVAEILLANPDVNVEVGGHSDADGKDEYNMKLSDARANAVRNYLITKGVPAERLTARGYGETHPIADNVTPEGKAQNRRVELKRI
ncbi:MAG TPA: PKD domain-containing protein [Candidatus Krumholzibacteria bacterium]|nr:PKD domain-containing protein [Candidatus Krumholzibacteria bacterium]